MNFLIIPVILGLTVVMQGTLNKKIADSWGLGSAVFLNATVFFVLSGLVLLLTKVYPDYFPDFLKFTTPAEEKSNWWYLVPGICGFILVLGLPWSIKENGFAKTFVLLVSTQVLLSVLLSKDFSAMKIAGALLSVAGAAMVVLF